MKKILSITIVAILLSLSLVFPVFATTDKYATFSEDLQSMIYNGKPYTRTNTVGIYYYEDVAYSESGDIEIEDIYTSSYLGDGYQVKLSDTQKETIEYIYLSTLDSENNEVIFDVDIEYKDGATLSVSYLRNDFLDEYQKLQNNELNEFYVEYGWPEGNTVAIEKDVLNNLPIYEFDYWNYDECFWVEGCIENGNLRKEYGEIRYIDGSFYYYNPDNNKELEKYLNSDEYIYGDYSYGYDKNTVAKLNKITDEATITALKDGIEKYYDDDLGYIYDDELLEGVSAVFLCILFGVIPAGVFIAFTILAIKATKKTYRKIYIAGCVFTLAELIAFIITAILMFT